MDTVRQTQSARSRWATLLAAVGGLLLTTWAAPGALARPDGALAAVCGLTAGAALFRSRVDHGVLLGGAGLAWLALLYGPVWSGIGGLGAYLLGAVVAVRLESGSWSLRHRWRRLVGAGSSQLAAGVAAGWAAWVLLERASGDAASQLPRAALLSGLAYFGVLVAFELVQAAESSGPLPWAALAVGLAFEAGSWSLGAVAALVVVTIGWAPGAVILLAVAAIAAELVRRERRWRRAADQVRRLQELQLAGHRIIFGDSNLLSIARQIFAECRRVVPFSWFHFQLAGEGGWERGWWAGPEGMVREGEPQPPPVPTPLPGIHRRVAWKVLTRVLASGERTAGRLRLWCDPRRLDPESTDWLDALLPEMTSSVLSALLDREARHDPLTGLPDRRALEERLVQAFRDSVREGIPTAVVMCDLDRFKRINDRFGHAVGDQALKALAELLEAHRRENDLCARYGGEEFSIVLERTDAETALAVAERLRAAVENHLFAVGEHTIPLKLSAGVAAYPELHVKEPQELMELADVALYEAKRQGRNRCLVNLGRGRFRTVAGEVLDPEQPPPDIEIPTLFS
jgi:diguanylate cyclase (GGDEF)-like protein